MNPLKIKFAIIALFLISLMQAKEVDSLNVRHWGGEVQVIPGNAIVMDNYQRRWQKGTRNFSIGGELHYSALPCDSDAFAYDYDYPTISAGVRYHWNHRVTMHRSPDPTWGLAEEVDYDSHMGNIISLYTAFNRPFFRPQRWMADYTLSLGTSYSHRKYAKKDNIDNELIGSHWLIYFGAGLHLTFRIFDDWGIKTGIEYYHHSNGALNRPNKGANFFGPIFGLTYMPYYKMSVNRKAYIPQNEFQHYWFLSLTVAAGMKTLDEDWQQTQFHTPSINPDYRTEKFKLYTTYGFSADIMCRYQRRWALGIGIDAFYGTYASHIEDMDHAAGYDGRHSPFSLGIAGKHEVFWHQFSLDMSLGYYLYRHMGHGARNMETPYYERIGIHYTFKNTGGIKVGVNVKAHKTKADYTEIAIGINIPQSIRRKQNYIRKSTK